MALGRLNPKQYYQASGEATEQAEVPTEFQSSPKATAAIHTNLNIPPSWNGNTRMQPIVQRAERTVGMKYLYAHGAQRMPIQPLGADGVPRPYTSKYQPNNIGPIRNCAFNDALFQAGYPGYNLGLSFKVQTVGGQLNRQPSSPGVNMRMRGPTSATGATNARRIKG